MGLIPLLIFLYEASMNTFLELALNFFDLFLRSGVGTTSQWRFIKLRFQFQVHLDQLFCRMGNAASAENLRIGRKQFLQTGVKVQTIVFLLQILRSMEVALSTFIFFLPVSSFGR